MVSTMINIQLVSLNMAEKVTINKFSKVHNILTVVSSGYISNEEWNRIKWPKLLLPSHLELPVPFPVHVDVAEVATVVFGVAAPQNQLSTLLASGIPEKECSKYGLNIFCFINENTCNA